MSKNPKILLLIPAASIAAALTTISWLVFGGGGARLGAFLLLSLVVVYIGCRIAYERFVVRETSRIKALIKPMLRHGDETEDTALADMVVEALKKKDGEIERLRRQEALRKEFIADVSHELKTPIFAAQGFVHTLLDGAAEEKAVRKKFLTKAAKSLDGLDMLVQDLLMLSQIESGQIKMRFRRFDLYDLTEEVFEQFRAKVNRKDIALRIEGAQRKVTVYGDESRIGQVLTNLISNAINHSIDGSEVVVSFMVNPKSVITEVRDLGEGISEEHIHRVFERFYRVDKSRSREKGGTGLGLAIVKHILDGHATKAKVKSEPGKGSTFSFKLPRERKEKNENGEHAASTEG